MRFSSQLDLEELNSYATVVASHLLEVALWVTNLPCDGRCILIDLLRALHMALFILHGKQIHVLSVTSNDAHSMH